MKKGLFILLAFAATAVLPSCIEDAEVTAYMTPEVKEDIASSDPDKIFAATVAGMQADMQSYYRSNLQHNYFGQKSFDYLTSLMGNDMVMTGQYGMSLYHYLLDYWAQEYVPTANRWSEYYRCIAAANSILESIAEDETDPAVLKYKLTALGYRGYAYLQLATLYSFAYYTGADDTKWGKGAQYDHSQDLCVPIITVEITGQQPRSTVEEVYDLLIGDLEEAYSIAEQTGRIKTADPSDVDGCVVATYLARAYMLKHDWTNALKYAQVVIDNFDVLTGSDILQGFSSISLPDVVWGCPITADNTTVYMSWFSQMDMFGDGYAGIGVWRVGFKPTVDRISDTDIRLDWFCTTRNIYDLDEEFGLGVAEAEEELEDATEEEWEFDKKWPFDNQYWPLEYQSCKFIGAGRSNVEDAYGEGWEVGDYIYLRSEEAYLMKAEILAHQGNTTEAVNVLTDFMKTRDPQYTCTATTKADVIEEINFQKRIEFWGEGIEYLDNRRLNIPVDRTDATWGAANNNHYPSGKLYAEQESRPFRYQLPISEIENNKEISASDQN